MQPLAQIYNPAIKDTIGGTKMNAASLMFNFNLVITEYLGNFLIIGFIIGSIIFTGMLIIGAVEYISAGGEKERVGNATKRITHALTGLTILLLTFVIVHIVQIIFGINILKFDIPII